MTISSRIPYQHESENDSEARDHFVAKGRRERSQESDEAGDEHAAAEYPSGSDDLSEPAAR